MSTETASVSMSVHEEFERRVDDNKRALERRLDALENEMSVTRSLAESIAKMTSAMESMRDEQRAQRDEMREIHGAVLNINTEYIEHKLNENTDEIRECKDRLHKLEMTPQDSESIAERVQTLETQTTHHHNRIESLEKCTNDQEERLRTKEKEPAENWKKVVGGVIAGVVTFLVGMACHNMFS